ncbi:E3 ubiquitin-protein ligase Topors-like [Heliangelus exortis]|uniref:E3 ubiquitin-protein ligase Topors-like n=1 Tax=Heliangelus exortis TaxID=472823 RepID=UPI003A9163BC
MANESRWCCPICYSHEEGIASLSPCRHQFCLGCALRWTQLKKSCPLCRAETTSIRFSERSDDDFLMFSASDPTEPWAEDEEDEQVAAEPVPRPLVGGFPPEVWAAFFRSHPFHFRPLMPWLQRELRVIFRGAWWTMHVVEVAIMGCLCSYGLDEELLLEDLSARNYMTGNTETFVRQLIETASQVCIRDLQRHLAQQNPATTPSSTNSSNTTPSSTSSPFLQSRSSSRRSQRWQWQVPLDRVAAAAPLLPAGSGNTHPGGPSTPQRGEPCTPRTLPSPTRGHATISPRGAPQDS